MRKIIFSLFFILFSVSVFAQSYDPTGTAALQRAIYMGDTLYRNNMGTLGNVYWYTKPQLDAKFANIHPTDTSSLSNRINQKVNLADSLTKWVTLTQLNAFGTGYIPISDIGNFVPYAGANANVDLGLFNITGSIANFGQEHADAGYFGTGVKSVATGGGYNQYQKPSDFVSLDAGMGLAGSAGDGQENGLFIYSTSSHDNMAINSSGSIVFMTNNSERLRLLAGGVLEGERVYAPIDTTSYIQKGTADAAYSPVGSSNALKGGSAGTVLYKTSGADFAFAWQDFSFGNVSGSVFDSPASALALNAKAGVRVINRDSTGAQSFVTQIELDNSTGISTTMIGPRTARFSLGSAFKYEKVTGQPTLTAIAEDSLSRIAGYGSIITTNNTSGSKSMTFIIDTTRITDKTFLAINNIPKLSTQLNKKKSLKIIGRNHGQDNDQLTPGTDFSSTSRSIYYTTGGLSVVKLFFGSTQASAAEGGGTFQASIVHTYLENANSLTPLTKNGVLDMVIPASAVGGGAWSDEVGFYAPAASNFFAREFKRIPKFPTSPSVTAASGGGLTSGTTYFYVLTTVDDGLESSFSTEVSVTPSSSNLAASIAWTAPLFGQYVNIYRSTTTGTEKFLAQVPVQQVSYVDNGLYATSTISPPASYTYSAKRYVGTGESANTQYASGGMGGLDVSNAFGAITSLTGPVTAFMIAPTMIVGDDYRNIAVLGIGDSIEAGTGLGNMLAQFGQWFGNWFDQAFPDNTYSGTANMAIASSQIGLTLLGSEPAYARLQMMQYADYLITNWGHNDLYVGHVTWQALATSHLELAKQFWQQGGRYVLCTLLPTPGTSDSYCTITGQTQASGTTETSRQNFNIWVRSGCQVDGTGAPVLTGGTKSPYIYNYFDLANVLEVNSSNVITLNGGYLLSPTAPDYTGQILTGTPTTTAFTVGAANYPLRTTPSPGLVIKAVKMTSGSASGQSAEISVNTATTITLYANGSGGSAGVTVGGLTTTPATGDTFSIYTPYTQDGTHPSLAGHTLIGAALAAWATTNIVKYGSMLGN